MKILHLTLEKKWFDLIKSGKKKDEYREDKPHWDKRLVNQETGEGKIFDVIKFRNGYRKDSPVMFVEFKSISFTSDKFCKPKHGEIIWPNTIVIHMGKILEM